MGVHREMTASSSSSGRAESTPVSSALGLARFKGRPDTVPAQAGCRFLLGRVDVAASPPGEGACAGGAEVRDPLPTAAPRWLPVRNPPLICSVCWGGLSDSCAAFLARRFERLRCMTNDVLASRARLERNARSTVRNFKNSTKQLYTTISTWARSGNAHPIFSQYGHSAAAIGVL